MRDVKRWAVLGLLLLAACGTGSGSSGSSDPTGDAGAFLACGHFRDVADDASKSLLTHAELRTKLQEVYHDAKLSEEPGVAGGAQAMLADVTSGDLSSLGAHITAFSNACSAAGF